jgi:glycosyltransferase involved in cell wall biosynthesis
VIIDTKEKVSSPRSASSSPVAVTRITERPRTVAMVGTYPPTACGLATFTSNLSAAIVTSTPDWRVAVVRLLDEPEVETHEEVVAHWLAGDRDSLSQALTAIGAADVVVLQHEYGLFGGEDGQDVLELVGAVTKPLVAVLHTVLSHPTEHQREILESLIAASSLVVVQSNDARRRLVSTYGVDPQHVAVVPHGAEENLAGPPQRVVGHPCILTWGLLGPGKGIEHGIAAVARLQDHEPAPTYLIAGRTHPKVLAAEGETYRRELQQLCRDLGVADRVIFDDGYHDWDSLRALVRRADVVLLPYDSLDQESSGVLVEALASGQPVVATRFPHARELLSRGAGLLVRQGDAGAMSAALERVLYEPGLAESMRERARHEATALLWPTVGATYRELISRVATLEEVA